MNGLDARRTTPTAGTYWALAAGAAAFTLYGSFVPFQFVYRPWPEIWGGWEWVWRHRVGIESRSDFAANVLLGGPLGFCVLAALRVDRPGPAGALLWAAAVWPACVLFAAGVEFGQLYFPNRSSSASDVIAQGIGSAAGMLVWLAAGPRLTRWARKVWAGPRVGGTAGRVLVAYLGVLALVQLLPMDLSLSPADLARKIRRQVTAVPFGELTTPRAPSAGAVWPQWLELAGLYAPVGLLLAARGPGSAGAAVRHAAVIAVGMELLQFPVVSRTPSATDVVIGAAATLAGWAVGRSLAGRPMTAERSLLLGQFWAAGLLAIGWAPFDFDRPLGDARWRELDWVPFAAAYEKNYLSSLEEALTKLLLFAPLGALAAAGGTGRRRLALAAAAGGLVAAAVEAGQLFLPSRYAGPTDVIYGAAGGWLGGVVGRRLRAAGGKP